MKIGREIERERERRELEREKVVWKNEEESDSGHTLSAFYKKKVPLHSSYFNAPLIYVI